MLQIRDEHPNQPSGVWKFCHSFWQVTNRRGQSGEGRREEKVIIL